MAHVVAVTRGAPSDERNGDINVAAAAAAAQPRMYGLLLLNITINDGVPGPIRQQCAILFKNHIKKDWSPDDGNLARITADDRMNIKAQVVDVMVRVPALIQLQLSEAIAIIGKTDFTGGEWPELLPHLVAQFGSGDFHVISGVLQTVHPLFKRYRYEAKSDELWTEIKHVLEHFSRPLTELYTAALGMARQGAEPAQLPALFNVLLLVTKLFQSLNCQDLPEFFEDHMELWFTGFRDILAMPEVPALASDDEDRPGTMEKLKTEVLHCVSLYALKYDEEFDPYFQPFVEATWTLLVDTGSAVKYDALVSVAMKFLAHVARQRSRAQIFGDAATLQAICQKIVVPNMTFRECDQELFEDNAEEYIRRDQEGADADTRRRGATDLVRGLCVSYESDVISIFSDYITQLLANYAANPAENWQSKDAAIFLVTSLAVKGEVTGKGATETSALIPVTDFLGSTILPDLQSADVNVQPVLKADALKFYTTFRNVLAKEHHVTILPMVANFLRADSPVVMSYAALCIERVLLTKRDGAPLFSEAEVGSMAQALIENLFAAMAKPGNGENEYLMKAVLRTISIGKGAVAGLGVLPLVTDGLSQKMLAIAKEPSNARYTHYMFETMSCCIRHAVATDPSTVTIFEQGLFPPFQLLLEQEIYEFQPYVFQIMAQMLEAHSPGPIEGTYMSLFPCLLQPVLWESSANSSGLVRLLQAYIVKAGAAILEGGILEQLLGIFQRLISSKAYDHEGFNLLGALVDALPMEMMAPYLAQCYTLCFSRISKLKTVKFVRSLLTFTCLLTGKYGGSAVITMVDGIQAQLWAMLVNRFVSDVEVIPADKDRKVVTIGITKLLFDTPEMIGAYVAVWPLLCSSLYKWSFEMDGGDEGDEEKYLEQLEASGYKASFNKLAFAGAATHDPFGSIENPQMFFATSLANAGVQRFAELIPAEIHPKIGAVLSAAGLA